MIKINQISDQLAKFKINDFVHIKWNFDSPDGYIPLHFRESYPDSGKITHITSKGIFVKSRAGFIAMVGIYDIASGTSVEVVR